MHGKIALHTCSSYGISVLWVSIKPVPHRVSVYTDTQAAQLPSHLALAGTASTSIS